MLTIHNLNKIYKDGSVHALNNMSFSVSSGEIVALMGPSGCGKSTLLNLIGALDQPDSGMIEIDRKPLQSYKPFDRYRSLMVGFIFQFHHLIPYLTLLENVMLPMYSQKVSSARRREKATRLLCKTGLEHRLHFYPSRVSGGERQRAAIARALVNAPRMVLADEPTGSIDSHTGKQVITFLIDYCLARSITVLIATHNREIAHLAQRTIFMRDGQIEPSPAPCNRHPLFNP